MRLFLLGIRNVNFHETEHVEQVVRDKLWTACLHLHVGDGVLAVDLCLVRRFLFSLYHKFFSKNTFCEF